jgi:hypothetical protein
MDLEKRTTRIKIGDGIHTFNELPYSTITPDDIQDMIDKSMVNVGAIHSVVLSSGTRNGTLKLVINGIEYDDIEVTGLGSAAYTNASDYATAEQGKRADVSMVYRGSTVVLPTGDISIGDTYCVLSDFTIPYDESTTGSPVKVTIGDTITYTTERKWGVMPKGVADTANSLTEGISANITGGAIGKAEAANAGETMNIEITQLNTDYLKQGTKVIVLNGGNATS